MINAVLFFLTCYMPWQTFAAYKEIKSPAQQRRVIAQEEKKEALNERICELIRQPIIDVVDCSLIQALYRHSLPLLRHEPIKRRTRQRITDWGNRTRAMKDLTATYQSPDLDNESDQRKLQIILWKAFRDSFSKNFTSHKHLSDVLELVEQDRESAKLFHDIQTLLAKPALGYQDYLHICDRLQESELEPCKSALFIPYLNKLASRSTCDITNHFKRSIKYRQLQMKANRLRACLDSTDNYQRLINTLEELKDCTSALNPEYKKLDDEIALVLRRKYYFAGEHDNLLQLDREDTDPKRKAFTQRLIHRLEQEYRLAGIVHNEPKNSLAMRDAYLELLGTYEQHDQNYERELNRVCRIDIEREIEAAVAEPTDPISFYTKMYRLKHSLAELAPSGSPEQNAILAEIEQLKPYIAYTHGYFAVETALAQPLDQAQAEETYALLDRLHDLAAPLYAQDARAIPMTWIDEQRTTYAEHCATYEKLAKIRAGTETTPVQDIQALLLNPILDAATKNELRATLKAQLISLIGNTTDNREKIKLIRQDLLNSDLLTPNEQISWNNKLAVCMITKKIHALRQELSTKPAEGIRINKELAALYQEREAAQKKCA